MRKNMHTAWNKAYGLVSSLIYLLPSTSYFYNIRTGELCSSDTLHKFGIVKVLE